ncbi:MAG TPA: T9SS type A sorting domain-containing protein [Bacteroidia bacterium]|jgi:hypothetical protein|nr:T9SS type A sorting domain-containing protein [Bacteroidia bacterium]
MKKNLLFPLGFVFAMVLPANSLMAQITVTQNNVPNIGTTATMAVDTSGSFLPQAASASSQVWNYGTLGNISTNSYIYIAPSATPYYSAFHSSNIADSLVYGSGYTYNSSTPASYSETGFAEQLYGYTVGLNVHPFYEQIPFPATYGTIDGGVSRGDTIMAFHYLLYDSARASVTINYADTIDAFGVMTTPYGTDSVIRQKHYDITHDSAFVHNSLTHSWSLYRATDSIDYQYRWYAKGINYYFAVMQMDINNQKVINTEWYSAGTVGIDEISHSVFTTVYPNPCKTQITFDCTSQQARQISIFDITGRQLSVQPIRNGILNLNTSAYSAGMYFYRVSDIAGNILDRGKFIVQ